WKISKRPCCDHGEAMPVVSVLTIPSPGADTSTLARRLITILPSMTLAEALKTTRIHRAPGRTGDRTALVTTTRPCRPPHHTLSDAGLIGGGHVSMPGDVSLDDHDMRLLDAWPEFRRHVLEVLHQPLEKSVIYLQSRGRPGSRR